MVETTRGLAGVNDILGPTLRACDGYGGKPHRLPEWRNAANSVKSKSAMDAESTLIVAWSLGDRGAQTAKHFVDDVAQRLSNRVQLATDGHRVYLGAAENVLGCDLDYAMLVETFESTQEETRYSPPECVSCEPKGVSGNPDIKRISTSFVGRHNWSVHTSMSHYTRLSNVFSRKVENHAAAAALNYFAHNFTQIHRTLRMAPATAA